MAATHFQLYVEIIYNGFICTAAVMHTTLLFGAPNTFFPLFLIHTGIWDLQKFGQSPYSCAHNKW